jgi:hypothetical protein
MTFQRGVVILSSLGLTFLALHTPAVAKSNIYHSTLIAKDNASTTDADIAFIDIFHFLIKNVTTKSGVDLFEAGALQNIPTKTVDKSNTIGQQYQYNYGPDGKGSRYAESPTYPGIEVLFIASDYSSAYEKACLTFGDAEAQLKAQGWRWLKDENDGIQIGVAYMRAKVSMKIDGAILTPPILEPWNSAEVNSNLIQNHNALINERQKIDPTTSDFKKTCVMSLVVNYKKEIH